MDTPTLGVAHHYSELDIVCNVLRRCAGVWGGNLHNMNRKRCCGDVVPADTLKYCIGRVCNVSSGSSQMTNSECQGVVVYSWGASRRFNVPQFLEPAETSKQRGGG